MANTFSGELLCGRDLAREGANEAQRRMAVRTAILVARAERQNPQT